MIWFNGTVKGAVDRVTACNCLLLVFIKGEDDLSKAYETFLDEDNKLKPEDYVAIKISKDSVAHEQFRKIYVTIPVPSVFLIGTNGIPLGIVCSRQPSDLHTVFADAVVKQTSCKNESIHFNEKSNIQISKTKPLKDAEKTSTAPSRSRKRDIDCETNNFLTEDKKLRFETSRIFPTFFFYDTHSSCDKTCISQRVQSARIQFRLPSNEMRSWEFPNMCTLNDVRLYLMETMKLSSGFKLLRMYPRMAFTPQDEDKTLTDLSLTPTATLIVVPLQDEAIQARFKKMIMKKNIILTFVTVIFQPVFSFINYLKKFMAGSPEEKTVSSKKVSDTSVRKRIGKRSASNVHGFAFDDGSDTDSDMNTDNGNSTQQK